ncbi:MAG: AzlD domain-containing protein [Spirochaetaceae bacterium]|jgi:branched-subunit amino acid transport protein AzlD|nr:AzlD domain-containing protein [Spirochaetaceae bacterium]
MALNLGQAFLYTFVMAVTIFLCRIFPFIVFRNKTDGVKTGADKFIAFVENTAPAVVTTVLAFNSISSGAVSANKDAFALFAASLVTVFLHIWKRNALLSIASGTAVYVLLFFVKETIIK